MQFTQDFFKPEIREGFEIPAMMKRAWAAQMEVLQVVADICEENSLQYFADWGTLLGAVRHQGFIPWDDDIDICLKREDYNRLVSILPQQLPHGFVVAGMYAGTERLRMAAYVPQLRVMADETLWDFNDYMKYFHGFPYQRAGIDIFPLDYIPVEDELADIQKIMMKQGTNLLENWTTLENAGRLEESLQEYEKLCNVRIDRQGNVKNWLWKLTDAIASVRGESMLPRYHPDDPHGGSLVVIPGNGDGPSRSSRAAPEWPVPFACRGLSPSPLAAGRLRQFAPSARLTEIFYHNLSACQGRLGTIRRKAVGVQYILDS